MDSGNSIALEACEEAEGDAIVAMPQPDRRDAPRQISVFLTAKITASERELPCRVLNISSGGAKIETRAALQVGDAVRIEFRSNLLFGGTIRWQKGTHAGIAFDQPVDLDAILKKAGTSIARIKPRLPRYRCRVPVSLESGQHTVRCEATDISLNGVRLERVAPMRPGETVSLAIDGLSRHRVMIVWNRGEEAGVRLLNPFRFDELEGWLAANQEAALPC